MLTRQNKGKDTFCARTLEHARTLRECRPRRHDIVHEQDIPPLDIRPLRDGERPFDRPPALRPRLLIKRRESYAAREAQISSSDI